MRRASAACVGIAVLAVVLVLVPCAGAHAQRDVAERVHREGRYPSDVTPSMPELEGGRAEGAGGGPHGETRVDRDRTAGETGTGDDEMLPIVREILEWLAGAAAAVGGPIAYVLLALGLMILAMFVGYVFVRLRLPSPELRSRGDERGEDGELDPMLVGPGGTPDELAAEGRWGEAIHALFLGALDRVGGREGRMRSRTARELVRRVRSGASGREELGELLDVTELVWFGGRAATEEQYLAARALSAAVPEQRVIADDERDAISEPPAAEGAA